MDAPLSTATGLPTKEQAKMLVRDIAGKPYPGMPSQPETDLRSTSEREPVKVSESANPELWRRVCLITGASSGVGAEAAKTFAKAGLRVVLTARREEKLKELVGEIMDAGGVAAYTLLDVSDNSQMQAAFEFA